MGVDVAAGATVRLAVGVGMDVIEGLSVAVGVSAFFDARVSNVSISYLGTPSYFSQSPNATFSACFPQETS